MVSWSLNFPTSPHHLRNSGQMVWNQDMKRNSLPGSRSWKVQRLNLSLCTWERTLRNQLRRMMIFQRNTNIILTMSMTLLRCSLEQWKRWDWQLKLVYYIIQMQLLQCDSQHVCNGEQTEFIKWSTQTTNLLSITSKEPPKPKAASKPKVKAKAKVMAWCAMHTCCCAILRYHMLWCTGAHRCNVK